MNSDFCGINYQAEKFPNAAMNKFDTIKITWEDMLHAALTVGRPNRHFIFRHGIASVYEAFFRMSMIRMTLEKSTERRIERFAQSKAFMTLDPTEKGAVNYFIGMIVCKLFATKILNTPWLLHLDVFRPDLDVQLKGRSRPDLIGTNTQNDEWYAFECKGRSNPPGKKEKEMAKHQATRIVSVNGKPCALNVGAITYFNNNVLEFYWCDPPPESKRQLSITVDDNVWQYYYKPIVQIVKRSEMGAEVRRISDAQFKVQDLDLDISIHQQIFKQLMDEKWGDVFRNSTEACRLFVNDGFQPDGIKLSVGESWARPFNEVNTE
jgi:hypothetical protein